MGGEEEEDALIILDCLLPTGIIIPLPVNRHAKIEDIKEEIWREAPKYPLYSMLKDKNTYVLMCINEMACKVELEDETQRLSDARLFHPMVKVIEKKGNRAEKILSAQISVLLGKGWTHS
jgi:phosphatidylinositol-4,5-bisphosphate 3-kinase